MHLHMPRSILGLMEGRATNDTFSEDYEIRVHIPLVPIGREAVSKYECRNGADTIAPQEGEEGRKAPWTHI